MEMGYGHWGFKDAPPDGPRHTFYDYDNRLEFSWLKGSSYVIVLDGSSGAPEPLTSISIDPEHWTTGETMREVVEAWYATEADKFVGGAR